MTEEGTFWMNCVKITKKDIVKAISPQQLQERTETFFYLGLSLGRIVDLGNISNTVYCVLQLFEEIDRFNQLGMKEDPMNQLLYPHPLLSFAKQQSFYEKQAAMAHAYQENNNVHIGGAEEFGAAEEMGGGLVNSAAGEFEEVKQGAPDLVFRNPLPYVEKPVSTFKDYKDRNFNDKRSAHS